MSVTRSHLYCTLTSRSRDTPVKVAAVVTLAVSCPESAMELVSPYLANSTSVAMDTKSPDEENMDRLLTQIYAQG